MERSTGQFVNLQHTPHLLLNIIVTNSAETPPFKSFLQNKRAVLDSYQYYSPFWASFPKGLEKALRWFAGVLLEMNNCV